jgi:hypothetical protein
MWLSLSLTIVMFMKHTSLEELLQDSAPPFHQYWVLFDCEYATRSLCNDPSLSKHYLNKIASEVSHQESRFPVCILLLSRSSTYFQVIFYNLHESLIDYHMMNIVISQIPFEPSSITLRICSWCRQVMTCMLFFQNFAVVWPVINWYNGGWSPTGSTRHCDH